MKTKSAYLKVLSSIELLDLYAQLVRCDHYDPHTTPSEVKELYNLNITQEDFVDEILVRMQPKVQE